MNLDTELRDRPKRSPISAHVSPLRHSGRISRTISLVVFRAIVLHPFMESGCGHVLQKIGPPSAVADDDPFRPAGTGGDQWCGNAPGEPERRNNGVGILTLSGNRKDGHLRPPVFGRGRRRNPTGRKLVSCQCLFREWTPLTPMEALLVVLMDIPACRCGQRRPLEAFRS